MVKEKLLTINKIHADILTQIDENMCRALCDDIIAAQRVFLVGVGREGMSLKTFAMRLVHLGFVTHWIWDETTPSVGDKDLFIVVNGSGNIGHINYVTQKAKEAKATIFIVTASVENNYAVSNFANNYLVINSGAYNTGENRYPSLLPMGTLFEEVSMVVYDAIVAELMERLQLTEQQLSKKHRNIE